MIRPGIQTLLAEAGESACYALDLVEIASRHLGGALDIVRALIDGIDHGFIRYNWLDQNDPNNFFIDFPDKYLELLTGVPWIVSKEGPDYQQGRSEYVVERWERQVVRQGKTETISHFRLPNWDSLSGSRTVMEGKVVSTRVFRRA